MVNRILALTKTGLKDWYIQRISAIVILVYVLFIMGAIVLGGGMTYAVWSALFSAASMKVFTLLFVLALIVHAWVGIWTVLTDYIHCAYAMATLQTLFIIGYVVCFIWAVQILF